MNTLNFDVVIVGGGLAGLSLACLLGQGGLRVACLEAENPQTLQKTDLRTTAISYGSAQILQSAGVWAAMVLQGCPIEDIEILDEDSPVLLRFLSREVAGKPFGWVIANTDIRASLLARIDTLPQVRLLTGRAVDFIVQEKQVLVTLADGQVLDAPLVVGADGRGSLVRDFMDVPVRRTDYKQRAIVCFLSHEHPHHNKAVEHFWPQGPFAVLPMKDGADGRPCSSLVFTEHSGKAGGLMALPAAEFAAQVQARMPERYGRIEVLRDQRLSYPLTLSHAARYIAPRMALVADAAHGIHPIAGQGLNLGFRDLAALSRIILCAKERGEDIGRVEVLTAYQQARRADNMAMIAATDGLVRLFSTDFTPLKALRRVGLRAVGALAPAKGFFMRRAMGE